MSHISKTLQHSTKVFLISIGLGLTLAACGGGGGGGQQSVSYSGNTNQATLDDSSAQEISTAYINADEQNVGSITGVVTSSSSTNSNDQKLSEESTNFLMQQFKQNALSSITNITNNVDSTNSTFTSIAIPDLSTGTPTSGDCSAYGVTAVPDGSFTTTLLSQSNTSLSVQMSYSNYCTYDIFDGSYLVVNGNMTATITGSNFNDPNNILFDTLTLNAPNFSITYTDSTESFNVTISQNYSFTFLYDSSNNITGTIANLTTDVTYNGSVYRFEIVVNLDATDNPTLSTYRFYHPIHGHVEYESTLTFNCDDGSPDSGILTITGSNASYEITPSGACDGQYTVQQL